MANRPDPFLTNVLAIEKIAARVAAWVIINPDHPDHRFIVRIGYPADGAGRLRAVAWLPGNPDSDDRTERHCGTASGYGYDKGSAAMSGAAYWDRRNGRMAKLQDSGVYWYDQIREAGYHVIQAV